MTDRCLTLRPQPTTSLFATSRCVVEYRVGNSSDESSWRKEEAPAGYGPTIDFFNRLQRVRIGDATLPQFFEVQGVSYWQFLPSYIWPEVFRTIEFITVVNVLVKEIRPTRIFAFRARDPSDHLWDGVINAIADAYKFPVTLAPKPKLARVQYRIRSSMYWRKARDLRHDIRQSLFATLARVVTSKQRRRHAPEGNERKLLFTSMARHWTANPFKSREYYDEQLFPLLPALRSHGWKSIVTVDCPYNSVWKTIPTLRHRVRQSELGISCRSFEGYAARGRNGCSDARRVFRQKWEQLSGNEQFRSGFRYEGIDLMPALAGVLKRSISDILPHCAVMVATARRILSAERPAALMVTYETGPFQRALIIEAARAGVPSLALMHGMIFQNHYDYMHENVTTEPVQSPFGFAVPSRTCVWGPHWKKNLVEVGHFPPDSVAVTGHWRYDGFFQEGVRGYRDTRHKRFNLNPRKKLILILTSDMGSCDYVRSVLNALRVYTDVAIRVKPHPAEDPGPLRELLSDEGLSDDTLLTDHYIDALTLSELIVSQYSTSVLEAALLGKPVVLVDFLGLSGWDQLRNLGICILVTRKEQLPRAIDRALNDPNTRKDLAAAREEVVADYFFRTDGRAAERVATELESLLPKRHFRATVASTV